MLPGEWIKPKTWNDVLALAFGLTIFAMWILSGCGVLCLPDIIIGATISIMTLIVQYYFRKAQSEKGKTNDTAG